MWTPLYTGHFGLVPKVSAFRGSTVHNNTLSQQQLMTMRSNDTLVDTPFQLISGFFHVFRVVSMLSKLPPRVCWGGGGGGGGNGLAK